VLLDHSEQVILERLDRCRIIVGACESSVFVRECTNCDMVVYTKQLRTRDCKSVRFGLYSQTRPVIETSVGLEIGCARLSWFTQGAAMTKARLNPFSSRWSEIHDFNRGASSGEPHWVRMSLEVERSGLLALPIEDRAGKTAKVASDDAEVRTDQPPPIPASLVEEEEIRVCWDGADSSKMPAWGVASHSSAVPPTGGVADGPRDRRLMLLWSAGADPEALARSVLERCAVSAAGDGAVLPTGSGAAAAATSEDGDMTKTGGDGADAVLPTSASDLPGGSCLVAHGCAVERTRVLVVPRSYVAALAAVASPSAPRKAASLQAFIKSVPEWPAVLTAVALGPSTSDASSLSVVKALAPTWECTEDECSASASGAGGRLWCGPAGMSGAESVQSVFLDWDAAENKG
jgi:hypothetical protein